MSLSQKKKKESKIEMDFIQKITLSPFQKYTRFQRFPWKFVCHLLLIILCTYQALKIVSIQDKHTRIQQEVFSTIYLQNDDGSSSYPYYSLSDFTQKFFDVIGQTKSLNQTLLQYSRVDDVEYRLEVYYTEITEDNVGMMILEGGQEEFLEQLAKIPLQQDNTTQMKHFLQNVQNMNLQINNVVTYISVDDNNQFDSCLNWTIAISYSFQSFANIDSSLEANSNACRIDESKVTGEESLMAIHLAVLIISSVSLVLSWKQVYSVSRDYMSYKKQIQHHQTVIQQSRMKTHVDWNKNWQQLGFFDKMKFFDFWFVVIVTGNFFQLFGALVAIFDYFIIAQLVIFRHKEVFIGFGVMLAWITILKYLEYSNNLNLMTSTLSKSWSNLFMFLLGVMPFFLGFVFLGQTIFWKYNKFEDTSSSVITLFSLLNGDIVNDTFLETWAQGLAGQIYLIIFMVLFYTAVQNVFVTIIMQGYQQSIKQREHKKMLQQKESQQKMKFQKNLQQIQEDQPYQQQQIRQDNIQTPQMSPQHSSGLSKIRKNGKKVDLILDQMKRLHSEINQSQLSKNQKTYLNKLIKDNLESISRNIKLQVKELRED